MIRYIDEVKDLKGVRVLLRLDLNVPIIDGQVKDPYRIEQSIETIDFLRAKGAQTIIIAHSEGKDSATLVPMWNYLNGFFPVEFCPTYFTAEAVEKITALGDAGVLMFENVRINDGEKQNDFEFAKKLSQMADIYVNDAFSVSHRKHASLVTVPLLLPGYGGLLLRKEIEQLSKAFNPKHPFVFILGGAKFDTKLPLIKKYLERADTVVVAGALANNVYREQGFNVGRSLVSEGDFGISEMLQNPKFVVPTDVTVTTGDGSITFKKPSEIMNEDVIVDAGPDSIRQVKDIVASAKTVVWNGPLGNYELGFKDKTESLAEIIAESHADSIVGGGDTLASIEALGINDRFTFISTGGGAMLDYLVNETLPALASLEWKE